VVRSALKKKTLENLDSSFRFRGVDNTRVEALSDGVFAIATALLVISSKVPRTYEELQLFLNDLVPFGICMTLLMVIWYQRRFSLRVVHGQNLEVLVLFGFSLSAAEVVAEEPLVEHMVVPAGELAGMLKSL